MKYTCDAMSMWSGRLAIGNLEVKVRGSRVISWSTCHSQSYSFETGSLIESGSNMADIQQAPETPCLCLLSTYFVYVYKSNTEGQGQSQEDQQGFLEASVALGSRKSLRKVEITVHSILLWPLCYKHTQEMGERRGSRKGGERERRGKGNKQCIYLYKHRIFVVLISRVQKLLRKGIVDLNGRNTLNLYFLHWIWGHMWVCRCVSVHKHYIYGLLFVIFHQKEKT